MKFVALTLVSIVVFDVSYGKKCTEDSECLTSAGMGCVDGEWCQWGSYFKDQANAPCLDDGGSKLWCFTSDGGAAKWCECWDDTVVVENKWCHPRLLNDKGEMNTMCKYPEGGAVQACGDVIEGEEGIKDQAVKDAIINKHNELRSRVAKGEETKGVDGTQPKAANMRKLIWNDELAEVAQRWVDQCTAGHDDNRRTETFKHVGQNWAGQGGEGMKVENQAKVASTLVENWYAEVKDISLKAVKSFSPDKTTTGSTGVIGHYTQVVWADSSEIGCGYMTSVKGSITESVLVCNYGPAGNWLRQPVYQQGEPGSMCPSGTAKTSDGLCETTTDP